MSLIKKFSWGTIVKEHIFGEYIIVEYINDERKTCYKPYINNNASVMSYHSFDEALVGCLTRKYEGSNNQYADHYICKMLGI